MQSLGDDRRRLDTKEYGPGNANVGMEVGGSPVTKGSGNCNGSAVGPKGVGCSAPTCPKSCGCCSSTAVHAMQMELQQQRAMLDKMHSMLEQLLPPARYAKDAALSDAIVINSAESLQVLHKGEIATERQHRSRVKEVTPDSVSASLCFPHEWFSDKSNKD